MAKTSAKISFSITHAKTSSVLPTKTDAKTFTMSSKRECKQSVLAPFLGNTEKVLASVLAFVMIGSGKVVLASVLGSA